MFLVTRPCASKKGKFVVKPCTNPSGQRCISRPKALTFSTICVRDRKCPCQAVDY